MNGLVYTRILQNQPKITVHRSSQIEFLTGTRDIELVRIANAAVNTMYVFRSNKHSSRPRFLPCVPSVAPDLLLVAVFCKPGPLALADSG